MAPDFLFDLLGGFMLNTLKKFYRFLWRYQKSFFSFLAVFAVAIILDNLGPYFYKILIDTIEARRFERIFLILGLFVGVKLLANLTEVLSHYLGDRVVIPASIDARVAVFRQIQDLDFAFHVNKNTGSLISAFKRGDGAFFEMFYNIHRNIFSFLLSLLIMIYFFIRITPLIALIILGIFIVNALVAWKLIGENVKKRSIFNKAEDRVSGIITDNLLNYETVKFFAKEEKEEKRLIEEFKDWSKKIWGYANTFRLMDAVIGSISISGIFLVMLVVLRKYMAQEVGVGDVVLVASFSTSFFYRFFELLYHTRNIAKHFVDIERYFAVLDSEILIKDPARPVKVKELAGNLVFKNVSFNYPDTKERVLDKINLSIPAGKSIAFVGRSGAGKTTIVKLLLRFYDTSKGKITLDGIDIKRFAKAKLRSFIGIVPQEPILFNNTIGYNIAYGNDKAAKAEIIEAARMANLHDFIDSLPKGYETEVGERGIKLSGGQKQRLAIARMILADPKIIIFDEATSNLDSESERLIQDALAKISLNRTVLIIAHRFSTVRRADKIVVMDNGEIVETGSHASLVKRKDGLYSYLWRLQTSQKKLGIKSDLLSQIS